MADALLRRGDAVRVLDNLSRPGSERNLAWLEGHRDRDRLDMIHADIRNAGAVSQAVKDCDAIIHLAAQVAVTASTEDPRHDFEVNAWGTLNVLEAARTSPRRPTVLFSSTNKVYGGMDNVTFEDKGTRYAYCDLPYGISEDQPLDFHSPYGCSKGAADQYVRDYARLYKIPTVAFRTSCIYGPRQFGNEDQGWVAHFVISALQGRALSVYGDGKQVRDVLYVDDAVSAYLTAMSRIDDIAGEVVNLGGGFDNVISLLELMSKLETIVDGPIARKFADWRPGDQRVYISDIRKLDRLLEWRPTIGVDEGVGMLANWVSDSGEFDTALATTFTAN